MNTINISLPKSLYRDAKQATKEKGYSSISELVRDGLRRIIYPELTENGFTPEFEEAVLHSAEESADERDVWETPGDVDRYFTKLHKKHQSR